MFFVVLEGAVVHVLVCISENAFPFSLIRNKIAFVDASSGKTVDPFTMHVAIVVLIAFIGTHRVYKRSGFRRDIWFVTKSVVFIVR